jgi:hypothetical protein
MPQCKFPVFCYFWVSKKLHKKYSRNWTKRSPKFLFFPTRDGVQSRDGGGPGGSHTTWWRPPSGRASVWCGPLGRPPTSPFRLYIALDAKTLKESVSVHEKFRSAAAIDDEFRGTEVSILAPCWDGELPLKPSPSTPPPSPLTLTTPMMRRE